MYEVESRGAHLPTTPREPWYNSYWGQAAK